MMNKRHTKAPPSKAKKNVAKNSASKKVSNKSNDLKAKTNNGKNNVAAKSANKKETPAVAKTRAALSIKKGAAKSTKNDTKNQTKASTSTAASAKTVKPKPAPAKKNEKVNKEKENAKSTRSVESKTPKAKPVKKIATKKNSIAKDRKMRLASLDANAKMKILTESEFKKAETNKDDTNKLKKDMKEETSAESKNSKTPSNSKTTAKTPAQQDDKSSKKNTEKNMKNVPQKAVEKIKKVTKKAVDKKKINKKKKAPIRKRNELGDNKAEIFDTKRYKRIASLNATAIMAATSITATSMAGRKPLDNSSDSETDDGKPQHVPQSPTVKTPSTSSSTPKTKVQTSVEPASQGGSAFTTIHNSSTPKSNIIKKANSTTKKTVDNKPTQQQHENGIKISPKTKAAIMNAGQTRKLEDLSSSKSAFSPCSPVREQPGIIKIEIGPLPGSTGSSRTDGSGIRVPKPKKIKVQTINVDNVKRDANSIPSSSRHMNDSANIRAGGSAFAQPAPSAVPSSHYIPMMQNNPAYYSNCFSNVHPPQPSLVSMGIPNNIMSQYAIPFSMPFVCPPMPQFSYASHLTAQPQPPQPAILSAPFSFQRQPTSSYSTNPFQPTLNFSDPSSMLYRQQPLFSQHSTVHQQPLPRFNPTPIFSMPNNNSTMHMNINRSAPSMTTSVTIEEIHDESGENEDVTIIPVVVHAPSDDDRSSLPSGSPRKKTDKFKTKSKFINGSSSSSKSTANLNGIVHASPNVVTNCIDIDQFEGNRTASNIATKTIHLPVNGNSIKRANHPQSPVPPSTAKKKAPNKDPNVIEIVLDDPNSIILKPNGPKNGSDRAIAAVILNNKKDKRVYHGWSWQGEPFYREVFINNDEKCTQKCFPAIRHLEGDIIRVRDCVLLKSGTRKNDLPFVAKIAALWQSAGDEMNMSLLWYYRPEQVDVKCDAMPGEIFASRHKDVNSVACIEDKCFVLTYNQWCRYKAIRRRFVNQLLIRPPAQESLDLKSHSKLPPINTEPEMVFFSSRVYDYRQKRILKSG